MYFNRTTFDSVGLRYPPPYNGRTKWDWKEMVDDIQNIDQYLKNNGIEDKKVFDFKGLYDEEMKLFSIILRNYGVPTISSAQRCGFCEETSENDMIIKNNTKQAIKEVIEPLFSIYKNKNTQNWCESQNAEWLKDDIEDYIKLDKIECDMSAPDSTYGIIFGSPPSMSNVDVITSEDRMKNKKSDLAVALVPGSYSFLGGSGLMISSKVNKERQDTAWEFIVFLTSLTENKFIEKIGEGANMISPYESLIEDNVNNPKWNIYIQQLRNSLPISYPRRTSQKFYEIEKNHPVRNMFFDILKGKTDIDKAILRTCKTINYFLEPECSIQNYNFTPDTECKNNKMTIKHYKYINATCHGMIDIKDESEVYVDCYYENYDTLYGIIVLGLVVVGITVSVCYISLFTAYRKADPIRKASYWFSVIIVVGSIFMYLSVLLDIGYPNYNFCIAKIWLMVLGFGCSLGGLVVKAYRIYSIFNNRDLKPLVITDKQLFKYFGIIIAIEIVCLLIWTRLYQGNSLFRLASDLIKTTLKDNANDNVISSEFNINIEYCPAFNDIHTTILIYGFNCILILIGCFLSIKTWSIPQMYSETKFMGSTIFMIGFVVLVCVPTINSFSVTEIKNRFILSSLAICFTCFLGASVFCIPKIYNSYLFFKQDYYKQTMEQNSNSLDYSTNNNGQIKFMLENNNSLMYKNRSKSNPYNGNSNVLSNETINRAAAMGNTLIDGNMLGINSKINPGFSILNSELNSSSIYHKRISRCRIYNNELQCPDCGCVFEVTD
ncbi:hypothetical protein BCR36DRAFT_581079 [Piromyces finnis]|uniref:G-protein coupled receptors family 3 profile domain-containing protein n=1 Tax=Piromyces finnis TaxID=1754191 RepID=A0A1Y1VIK1_9FUNG|nr:hypothetical protein BCR36DRAFT_581079 [Piromyces finnis]|eukprot:ORX55922.1 hypothetical protein BCR36DRAFT_581079 [Piromyces finnis]